MAISKVNERIQLIDGFDLGLEQRTGSYVLMEQQLTLIETGLAMKWRIFSWNLI